MGSSLQPPDTLSSCPPGHCGLEGQGQKSVFLAWAWAWREAGLRERPLANRCPSSGAGGAHVSAPAPLPSLRGLLSPQLWSGPRCSPPGPCTTQPQPDRGDLPASQHSGLSHEDGASEQPPGVSGGTPPLVFTRTHPRGSLVGRSGPVLCVWSPALGHTCAQEA